MDSECVSDSLSEEKGGRSATPTPLTYTYTKKFYEVFPYYLSIGMTPTDFWDGDCTLCKYYREANELKKDRKNEELWLQGLYIYEALIDASPIFNPYAQKGTKPLPYPKEPYPRSHEEMKKREDRDNRIRFEKMRSDMRARAEKDKNKEV